MDILQHVDLRGIFSEFRTRGGLYPKQAQTHKGKDPTICLKNVSMVAQRLSRMCDGMLLCRDF